MDEMDRKLLELKNTSELMIDLAYSSVLFNNTEIAEEVIFLDKRIEEIADEIEESILGMEPTKEVLVKALVLLRLKMAIEKIGESAASIADVVMRGFSQHPVISMSLLDSEVVTDKAEVSPASSMVNKSLGEIRLASRCGMFVIAIKRGRRYIYGPGKNSVLQEGDTLLARGPEDGAETFQKLASGKMDYNEL
ncbi:MAG: potassium channel family protein [Candidatus Methanomethylophilaceae archaeon]